MFERFVARQAILKDNQTLLGYDLHFRAEAAGESSAVGSPAAFLIDSSTMVFRWETLVGAGLAAGAEAEHSGYDHSHHAMLPADLLS